MSIAKVMGIETEFGILASGPDANPIAASSMLVNAYSSLVDRRTGWDFEDETPGNDARGPAREGSMAPIVETHLANTVLTNGARFYVDHAHPEYSSPECASPLDIVRFDRAGEEVMRRAMVASARQYPGSAIAVYKNNSDGKGNSYGCHENYLMDRAVPFAAVVNGVVGHFVTRQIFTGAGKVGVETGYLDGEEVKFQISQRSEFFEEVVGLETTLKRPIVNTRDEPHADPKRYRRLHVILGDANLSEVATYLKIGTTAIILSMIEDEIPIMATLMPAQPVRAVHEISCDLSLHRPIDLADGRSMTALEIQRQLFIAARDYVKERNPEIFADQTTALAVIDRWEVILDGLETDPESLATQLDWVAKRRVIEGYRDRHGASWGDPRLHALDLQYHDLRPERSLFARVGMETLIDADAVTEAITVPPDDTRAYFRGQCLTRWPDAVVTANWDSLVFDLGIDPLRRVPMMDPLKGTAAHVADLLAVSASPSDLLDRLNS